MLIDESLAQGLTKEFLEKLDDDFDKVNITFTKKIGNKLSSRKGFDKFTTIHKETFKNFTLSHQVGGSKRQPYLGEIVLNTKNDRKYKEWNEATLYGLTTIRSLSLNNESQDSNPSLFLIGEHAISRVFQRSKIFKDTNKIDSYLIVPELCLIPFWTSFWVYLLSDLSRLPLEKKLSINPVIPSPRGLFFCKLTNHGLAFAIEVRTYVHESSLTDTQKQVRLALLNASKNLENSILCLFPYHTNTPNKERSHFEFCIVIMQTLTRIKGDTYQLCEILLPEKNACDVYELDRSINNLIDESNLSEDDCNSQNIELNKKGYRLWMKDCIEELMRFKINKDQDLL